MRRPVAVFAVALLVLTPVVAGGHAGAPDGTERLQQADRPDLLLHVELEPDGDARWTVSTFVDLADDNDTTAFREQADQWEAGQHDVGYDADLFRRFADLAANATGREMTVPADSVNRSAEIVAGGDRGAFRLSFTWTNFGRRDGDRLQVDDAFRTASGTWLPELAAGQRLVIERPDGFEVSSAPEGARLSNGSRLIWDGPTTFSPSYFPDQPVVFVVEDDTTPTPTPTATPTPTDSPTTTVPPGNERSLGLWLGVLAAVLLGGGLALYRLLGDGDRPDGSPAGATSPDEGSDGEPPTGADASADADAEAPPEDGEDEPEPTPADPFAGVDEELLSDEERVLRLLEAHGGRMKQADIVTETGWSNAKVSQLLSGMAEDGDVDKLRIGRENLISLPDVEVGEVE